MNAKRLKKLSLIACSVLLVLATVLLTIGALMDNKTYVFADTNVPESYVVGEVVDFPSSVVTDGENEYPAQTVLHYPDGSVKMLSSAKLTLSGVYTLEYRAFVNGKYLKTEKQFEVKEKLYEVSSSISSAEYKVDDTHYQTGLEGIVVDLAEGTTFNYNKAIDIRKLGTDPIITLGMLPTVAGERDCNTLTITLTDAYDPLNQVIVRTATVHPGSYQDKRTQFQQCTSMMFAGTSPFALKAYRAGKYESIDTWYRYGYETHVSFSGAVNYNGSTFQVTEKYKGEQFLTIALDLENKIVKGPINTESELSRDGGTLIADLSNENVYDTAWKGFTTGEVYISISCGEYEKANTSIIITQLGNEDLSKDYFVGASTPEVFIDTEEYEQDNVPTGVVGTDYRLFKATTYDYYNGKQTILPRVFFNYGSPSRVEYSVSNGKFKPDRAGEYTFVYAVDDGFGQHVEKTLDIQVVEDAIAINVDLPSNPLNEIKAGLPIALAIPTVSGGSGIVKETVTATLNGSSVVVEDYNFTPKAIGEYTIKYVYEDYLGTTKEVSYVIESISNPIPVAETELAFPKYLIEGKMFELPVCSFVDYSGVATPVTNKKVTVIDGDGEHVLDGYTYTVKADSEGCVTFKYSATSTSGTGNIPDIIIPVLDTSNTVTDEYGTREVLDFTKYFEMSQGINAHVEEFDLAFTTERNGKIEFVNPLIAEMFNLKLKINPEKRDFSSLILWLKDSENSDICLKLELKKKNDANKSIEVYINDIVMTVSPMATFANDRILTISYNGKKEINFGSYDTSFSFKYDYNRNTFEGFPSNKVRFEFEFAGVTGVSEFAISKIANQSINNLTEEDFVGPEVVPLGQYELVNNIGTKLNLYKAIACDVLDTYANITITVKKPDGTYAKADDQTLLKGAANGEYSLTLNEFGSYSVEYKAYDSNGCYGSFTRNISVYDFIPPELYIEDEIDKTARVGNKIDLSSATVSDNRTATADIKVSIIVYNPTGTWKMYTDGMKYEMKGTYVVRYLAIDGEGNIAVEAFKIKVS